MEGEDERGERQPKRLERLSSPRALWRFQQPSPACSSRASSRSSVSCRLPKISPQSDSQVPTSGPKRYEKLISISTHPTRQPVPLMVNTPAAFPGIPDEVKRISMGIENRRSAPLGSRSCLASWLLFVVGAAQYWGLCSIAGTHRASVRLRFARHAARTSLTGLSLSSQTMRCLVRCQNFPHCTSFRPPDRASLTTDWRGPSSPDFFPTACSCRSLTPPPATSELFPLGRLHRVARSLGT